MGNACFSGNKDRVGDRGKEKPVEERPVAEEKQVPEEIPVTEGKTVIEEKPVVEENPVVEEKPVVEETTVSEEKSVEDKPVLAPAPKPASKPKRASKSAAKAASIMAGDHGNVHIVNNAAAWNAKLEEAKNTGKIIAVDFTATWCGPCRLMSPIFTELSKKFESLIFLKVDVDEVQDVTAKWEVRAMPTFLFIKDGKLLDRIVGANKDELERKCSHYASTTVSSSA